MNVWTSARIRLVIVAATVGLPDGAGDCVGAVLRPQQGPVQELRLPGAQDRALRHLLLPERARGRRHRRAHGRALARAPRAGARPRAARTPAARALRVASRLRADQRHSRRARRGHGRRHRVAAPPHRAAARRTARRHRSRDRPRAGPRVPVRHHDAARRAARARPAPQQLPLWFIEGMAEYLSLGPVDPHTAMWLRDAALRQEGQKLPDSCRIKDLDNPKYFPYRWGQAFWAYVGGRCGDEVIGTMLSTAAADSGDYERGDPASPRRRHARSSRTQWQASIRATYRADARRDDAAERDRARRHQGGEGLGGDLNVGPAISPDGKLDRVPVRAQRVLDRSVRRRRGDRQGRCAS